MFDRYYCIKHFFRSKALEKLPQKVIFTCTYNGAEKHVTCERFVNAASRAKTNDPFVKARSAKAQLYSRSIYFSCIQIKLKYSQKIHYYNCKPTEQFVGRGSSVGCASAWYADGRGFDPHVRQSSFVENGHEIISTTIVFFS